MCPRERRCSRGVLWHEVVTMKITDKMQMRALYLLGAFGNRWPAWMVEEYRAHPEYDQPAGLMYNGTPGAQLPYYALLQPRASALALADVWCRDYGCDPARITVSYGDHGRALRRLCNAEVCRDQHYCSLYFATVDDYMRAALAREGRHEQGIIAWLRLRDLLDAPSWENLQAIWDTYPTSVVEFTVYDRGVGLLGHNTVFWEVRDY